MCKKSLKSSKKVIFENHKTKHIVVVALFLFFCSMIGPVHRVLFFTRPRLGPMAQTQNERPRPGGTHVGPGPTWARGLYVPRGPNGASAHKGGRQGWPRPEGQRKGGGRFRGGVGGWGMAREGPRGAESDALLLTTQRPVAES